MSGAYDFPHLTVSNVFVMNLFEDWGDLKTSTIFFLFIFFFSFFFPLTFGHVWPQDRPLGQTTGTDPGRSCCLREAEYQMTQQAIPFLFWLKIIFTVCTVCHSLQARKAIIYIFNQPLLSPPLQEPWLWNYRSDTLGSISVMSLASL